MALAVRPDVAADPRIELHLAALEMAFDRRSWHGPNLMGSIRGVTLAGALWRPQAGRHNVAEIVVHCAYWKYRVCRLLDPDRHPAFGVRGSDWFTRGDDTGEARRRADVALLKEWHGRLMDAVRHLPSRRLDVPAGTGSFTVSELISGAASHDVYHAGQIRLLRRMCGAATSAG